MEDEGTLCTIDDLYSMSYQAASEGLAFDQYLHRQELSEISLEQSIENARKGLSTPKYLQQREETRLQSIKDNKREMSTIGILGTAVSLAILGIIVGSQLPPDSSRTYFVGGGGGYFVEHNYVELGVTTRQIENAARRQGLLDSE